MMVVQHNLTSMFTNRQLGITKDNKAKSTEKLASGYRINRASDDAAGLSISEKMRSQVRGLMRGAQNTQDGISLIHTADGAMNEQVNMLQRMRELTIQAYNTAVNQPEDMKAIQGEVDELLKELQRVAEETEFNKKKILQGNAVQEYTTDEMIVVEREIRVTQQATEFPFEYEKEMKLNNSNVPAEITQDKSKYVTFNGGTDDVYSRGPRPADIAATNWQGEWSEELTDNYSAYVDFSPLYKADSAADLRSLLTSLEGTGVGYACGSCSGVECIVFSGKSFSDINVYDQGSSARTGYTKSHIRNSVNIDLSSFESALDEIGYSADSEAWEEYGKNNIENFEDMTDAQKETAYNNAFATVKNNILNGDGVSDGILDRIIRLRNEVDNHFLRTAKVENGDKTGIAFYDLRDVGENGLPNEIRSVAGEGYIEISAKVNYYEEINAGTTYVDETPNYLQVGANALQGIYLDFPNMTLAAMGLEDYTIYPENGYCTAPGHSTWDEEFLSQCESLGDNKYRYTFNEGGQKIEHNETATYTKNIVKVETSNYRLLTGRTDKYGEKIPDTWTWDEKRTVTPVTYTVDRTWYTYEGGTTKTYEFEAYPPDSIMRIDKAINYVSSERSRMGAMENRLEYAYLYDTNAAINLQDAESRIRDTDMAEEMTRYAKENILEQAGISMLSQANSANQMIVQLLG